MTSLKPNCLNPVLWILISRQRRVSLWLIILILTFSLAHSEPLETEAGASGVLFSYNAPAAKSVTIAGEFNGWDKKKNPLNKNEQGIWTTVVPLKEGKTEYKFIIDGEWMPGDNLVVILKKNPESGVPEIPKGKPGIKSEYTQKIKFGGKYAGLLPLDLKTVADRDYNPVLSTPVNHVDLDWNVTPAEEADIFFRTELDTSRQPFNLLFKQGYLSFHPSESYVMKMYYNLKSVQFDDPVKITDRGTGLRYDGLYLTDELNRHLAYGLDTQGLHIKTAPLGLNLELFYSNYKNYQQDDIGVRAKTNNFGPVRFGATYFTNRGVQWPYANGAWFPDPQFTVTRATYTIGSIQPWYKGFLYNSFTSFDIKYDVLPETNARKIFVFGEYGVAAKELNATRWNEGSGKDSPISKSWPVFSKNVSLYGIRGGFSGFNFEASARADTGKFGQTISTDTSLVSFDKNYDFGSTASSLKIRYDKGAYSAGVAFANAENKEFNAKIEAILSPYSKVFVFEGAGGVANISVKKDVSVTPYIKISVEDKTKVRLIASIHNYEVFPAAPFYSGQNYIMQTVDHNSAAGKINSGEWLLDLSQNLRGGLFFELGARYSTYEFASLNKTGGYFTNYAAVSYKLRKNFLIRLGYGVDPEGFDEDIMEDFDRREIFLYNSYIASVAAGNSPEAAILSAEDTLARLQRISLRTEIRF